MQETSTIFASYLNKSRPLARRKLGAKLDLPRKPEAEPKAEAELPRDTYESSFSLREASKFRAQGFWLDALGVVGTVAASSLGASPLVEALKFGALTATAEELSHRRVPGLVKGRRLQALKKIAVGAVKGLATGAASLVHPALGVAVGLTLYAGDRYLSARRSQKQNLDSLGLAKSRNNGMDGIGTTIAVLDTGFGDHPTIIERTVAKSNFTSEVMSEKDSFGHATAMAGAACTVAPGADFAFLKVADSKGKVYAEPVAKAIKWAVENREKHSIDVLSMSFELDDPENFSMVKEALEEAVEEGMIPLASTGNSGSKGLGVLARSPLTLAVGNMDAGESSGEAMVHASSSRASKNNPAKPDCIAPGVGWIQPAKGGVSKVFLNGGSSTATAVAAAGVAIWRQQQPELNLAQARELIEASSKPLTGVAEGLQGLGALQIDSGIERLES